MLYHGMSLPHSCQKVCSLSGLQHSWPRHSRVSLVRGDLLSHWGWKGMLSERSHDDGSDGITKIGFSEGGSNPIPIHIRLILSVLKDTTWFLRVGSAPGMFTHSSTHGNGWISWNNVATACCLQPSGCDPDLEWSWLGVVCLPKVLHWGRSLGDTLGWPCVLNQHSLPICS